MRVGAPSARLLFTLASLLLAAPAVAAEAGPRLSVAESAGLARSDWPITVGMPLPKGWLKTGEKVHVGGQATQQRVLATWPDGSARWLLLDFQTALAARKKVELGLQKGSSPASRSKVTLQQQGVDVEIDTGAIRFAAGRGSGGFYRVTQEHGHAVKRDAVRGEMKTAGQVAAAEPPSEVVVEDAGPLRAAVRLRGRYANGFEYEVRLEAYAGQSFVRVLHTFINSTPLSMTPVERISVTIPQPASGPTYSASRVDAADLTGKVGEEGFTLTQVNAATFRGADSAATGRLAGWFVLKGKDSVLGLDAPFFWQEFTQAVRFGKGGIVYDLWSEGGGPALVGTGAAKTSEFFVAYGGGTVKPGRGVTASPDPTWTASSGALLNALDPQREGVFVGEARKAFGRYAMSVDTEPWDEAGACNDGVEIRRVGFYGMLNWGDWNFRGYHDTTKGCDAWGNQEYDLTQVLGLLFVATGSVEVRDFFAASARHYGEVDRIHYQSKFPDWVGMNHPKNPQHFSFQYGGVDLGHTWVEGLLTYYFLTGEPRAREAALGISDYLVHRLRKGVRGNPRQFGWPALALATAYEATGESKYRDASLEYAKLGAAAHPPKVGKDWKLGVLAEAISYTHAITGDDALRDWLRRYAAAVMDAKVKDVRFYPAVAYVAAIDHDAAMKQAAHAAAGRIKFGDWGKPLTIGARTGFRILSLTDR